MVLSYCLKKDLTQEEATYEDFRLKKKLTIFYVDKLKIVIFTKLAFPEKQNFHIMKGFKCCAEKINFTSLKKKNVRGGERNMA